MAPAALPGRPLGRTGVSIPVIGQGTWMMGEDPGRAGAEVEALRLGIELGMTLIDTAEMYGGGGAERVVGEAVKGCRDQVFIVSKVLPYNASYEGTIKACERSLRNLGTGWIDLYLLHWPSGHHPLRETMRAMEALVDRGLIRYIGISNFDTRGVRQVEQALLEHPLVCNQVLYHLRERGIEYSLIPYCRQQGITVMAYSPYGHGDFPGPRSEQGRVLAAIAEKHGKTPRQVALNFLTREEHVVAIPKAATLDHVRENAGAAGWELDEDDVAEINRVFPPPTRETPLAML